MAQRSTLQKQHSSAVAPSPAQWHLREYQKARQLPPSPMPTIPGRARGKAGEQASSLLFPASQHVALVVVRFQPVFRLSARQYVRLHAELLRPSHYLAAAIYRFSQVEYYGTGVDDRPANVQLPPQNAPPAPDQIHLLIS